MPVWRRLFVALFASFALASPAFASGGTVPLLNGSVISTNGLKMTVSGCTMILGGITQSSCSAGHIVMQGLSSGSSTGVLLTGDGTAATGTNVLSAASWSGLTQISFPLSVVASGSKTISSATTEIHGTVPTGYDLYNINSNQVFSAAAGGGGLDLVPAYTTTGTLSLTPANSFSVSNTLALNTSNAYGYGTLRLTSMQTTFSTAVPEPASMAALATGIAGLVFVRRRKRSKAKPLPAGGDMG